MTPFSGVTLEIGGAIETYWKSIASPVSTPAAKLSTPRFMTPSRSLASAQTSPSVHSFATVAGHSLTHSSLSDPTGDAQASLDGIWKVSSRQTPLSSRLIDVLDSAIAGMAKYHRRRGIFYLSQ